MSLLFFFFKSVLGAEKWQEMITGSAILYFLFVEKVQWSRGCSWKTEDRGMVKNEANGASEKENPRGKLIKKKRMKMDKDKKKQSAKQ